MGGRALLVRALLVRHEVSFWHPLRKNSKQATCWAGWHLGCIATTLGVPPNCPMGLVAIREAYSEYQ